MRAKDVGTRKKWVDPDDAPELTEAWFDKADLRVGNRIVRRGRPKLAKPKAQVTLRLDQDIVERFRAGGRGWQSRINATLRRSLARKRA